MPLTTKEQNLLLDDLNSEYLCIRKYQQYASMASDPQIKQLFSDLATKEMEHANTLKNILTQNNAPATSLFETYNQPQGNNASPTQNLGITDAQLLFDSLHTEKHVSSVYNTSVLESVDTNIRKQLQHIQQEEQNHAESLFNTLKSHGWYNVQ
ncbi:hypothetical protein Q428_00210 [Fervidicella metallireducens AeB]|uniref:Coat protein F n=1 Tax=Fervidicella metallireducens AeB TaxID=1403537 RepID=A0A017RYU3_9CLOT|nr:ferritin-like domain-containing protein [Fervidicella metallireducens]EYE89766.1 hypothetical protein Q428_00210 [Fervidicella metallireducens AeB]